MAHGHSHGGVACDGSHTRMNDDPVKKRRKAKKNRKNKDRSTSNRKGKKNKNSAIPCCSKERGIPRHCCCHELCCGWNGCGKRHNIKHLPLFQCMDPKKYRPGQRRRHYADSRSLRVQTRTGLPAHSHRTSRPPKLKNWCGING